MYFVESVYDILDCRKEKPKPRRRSTRRIDPDYVDGFVKTVKKQCETMGKAEYLPPNPANYLRAHDGSKRKPRVSKPRRSSQPTTQQPSRMPALPKDRPKLYHKKNINYIKENILSLKKIKPRVCDQKLVITRYGETVNGKMLEPKYIYLKTYGTVPEYIYEAQRCIESQAQREVDDNDLETKLPSCRYVTRVEREKLLNGLKENWAELTKQYQLLPVITDSTGRIKNKIEAEAKLEKIEKDILLVEKCPYIYIKN